VETEGLRARLFRRQRSRPVYLEVRLDGTKDRRSVGLMEKVAAEDAARKVLRQIVEDRRLGRNGSVLTFGKLVDLYLTYARRRSSRSGRHS
jgi:hypothetical protein